MKIDIPKPDGGVGRAVKSSSLSPPEAVPSLEASRRLTYSTSPLADCARDKAASTVPNPRLQLEKQSESHRSSGPECCRGAVDPRRLTGSLSGRGRCFLECRDGSGTQRFL